MGLKLLRLSGWNVPDETMKRLVEPIVLSTSFQYKTDWHPLAVRQAKRKVVFDINSAVEKHIHFTVEEVDETSRIITASLIIQREDPS